MHRRPGNPELQRRQRQRAVGGLNFPSNSVASRRADPGIAAGARSFRRASPAPSDRGTGPRRDRTRRPGAADRRRPPAGRQHEVGLQREPAGCSGSGVLTASNGRSSMRPSAILHRAAARSALHAWRAGNCAARQDRRLPQPGVDRVQVGIAVGAVDDRSNVVVSGIVLRDVETEIRRRVSPFTSMRPSAPRNSPVDVGMPAMPLMVERSTSLNE